MTWMSSQPIPPTPLMKLNKFVVTDDNLDNEDVPTTPNQNTFDPAMRNFEVVPVVSSDQGTEEQRYPYWGGYGGGRPFGYGGYGRPFGYGGYGRPYGYGGYGGFGRPYGGRPWW